MSSVSPGVPFASRRHHRTGSRRRARISCEDEGRGVGCPREVSGRGWARASGYRASTAFTGPLPVDWRPQALAAYGKAPVSWRELPYGSFFSRDKHIFVVILSRQ